MAENYIIEEESEEDSSSYGHQNTQEYPSHKADADAGLQKGSRSSHLSDESRKNSVNHEETNADSNGENDPFFINEIMHIRNEVGQYFEEGIDSLLLSCVSTCESMLYYKLTIIQQYADNLSKLIEKKSKSLIIFAMENFHDISALKGSKDFVKFATKQKIISSDISLIDMYLRKCQFFHDNISNCLINFDPNTARLSMSFAPKISLNLLLMVTNYGIIKTIFADANYYFKVILAIYNFCADNKKISKQIVDLKNRFGMGNISGSKNLFSNITKASIKAMEELCLEYEQRLNTIDSICNARYELMPNRGDLMDLANHPHIDSALIPLDKLISIIIIVSLTDSDLISTSVRLVNTIESIIANFNSFCSPSHLQIKELICKGEIINDKINTALKNPLSDMAQSIRHGFNSFLHQCEAWYSYFSSCQYIFVNNLQFVYLIMRDISDMLCILQNVKLYNTIHSINVQNNAFSPVELHAICLLGKFCELLYSSSDNLKSYYENILQDSYLSVAMQCLPQPNLVPRLGDLLQEMFDRPDKIKNLIQQFENALLEYEIMLILNGQFNHSEFLSQYHILTACFMIKVAANPSSFLDYVINSNPLLKSIDEIMLCLKQREAQTLSSHYTATHGSDYFSLALYFTIQDEPLRTSEENPLLLYYKTYKLIIFNKIMEELMSNMLYPMLTFKRIDHIKTSFKEFKLNPTQIYSTCDDISISSGQSKSDTYKSRSSSVTSKDSNNIPPSPKKYHSTLTSKRNIYSSSKQQLKTVVTTSDSLFDRSYSSTVQNLFQFFKYKSIIRLGDMKLQLFIQLNKYFSLLMKSKLGNANLESISTIALPSALQAFFDGLKASSIIYSNQIGFQQIDLIYKITDTRDAKNSIQLLNNCLNKFLLTFNNLLINEKTVLSFASSSFDNKPKIECCSLSANYELSACLENFGAPFSEIMLLCMEILYQENVNTLLIMVNEDASILKKNICDHRSKFSKEDLESLNSFTIMLKFIGNLQLLILKIREMIKIHKKATSFSKYLDYIDLIKASKIKKSHIQKDIPTIDSLKYLTAKLDKYDLEKRSIDLSIISKKLFPIASLCISQSLKNTEIDPSTGSSATSIHSIMVAIDSIIRKYSNENKLHYEAFLRSILPLFSIASIGIKNDSSLLNNLYLYYNTAALL
ncbi:MAG: hypothetical protein MHMPM18_001628 [Marteilia pararefringens]